MSAIDASVSARGAQSPRARASFVGRATIAARTLVTGLTGALERRRSRLMLLELTDEQLKDIGISRADAHREGIRPFWK